MKELSRENLADIVYGAAILGAGGGGDTSEGFELIDTALSAGKVFKLVSVHEVPDNALVCTPYILGAISALSEEEESRYTGLMRSEQHPLLHAYEAFQEYLGRTFYATVACELGGSNTAAAFFAAAMNDHYILDADPAGRAVPEITHSTYYLNDLPASPIFVANEFGETFVLNHVVDDMRAETLVRALCQVSRQEVAAIDHAMEMCELKSALIHGTITKAMHLGRTWRLAKNHGRNIAHEIAKAGGGYIGFKGAVSSATYQTSEGFTLGTIALDGIEECNGRKCTIQVKNENMAVWVDDCIVATVPDLITLVDTTNGEPITNPHACAGQLVAVIFLPAPAEFTSAKALSVFGPGYVGINAPYRPISERNDSKF